MANKFSEILNEIQKENEFLKNATKNTRILIVDGLNNYIRTWIMMPTVNEDGIHVGGITGFLQTLGVSIRILNPTRLIIVFDGKNSSKNRKKIFPEYKQNRGKGTRLNRVYDWNTDAEEEQQMILQLFRVIQYLSNLPCTIMMIDNAEADDVIGYMCTELIENNPDVKEAFIMSTDKDFYQLISDKIKVWNPIKKKIINKDEIIKEYQIQPHNFLLFKAMNGDSSDNIPGIKGIGKKTAIKHFPILSESDTLTTDNIIKYASEHQNSSRLCKLLLDNKEHYLLNCDLMRLTGGKINKSIAMNIIELFRSKTKPINLKKIIDMVNEDKLWKSFPKLNYWISTNFSYLNYFSDK